MNRGLPHDEDSERVLLGSCLLTESASPLVGVDPRLFYTPTHQRIATEILAMANAREPVAMGRLAQRLHGTVFGSHISALVDGIPAYDDLSFYRNRIIELAGYRRGAEEARALQQAYLSSDPEQITEALRNLESIRTQGIGRGETVARIELVDSSDFLARTSADERPYLIEGLIPAQNHISWQGRPKTGKSHSLLQLAYDASSGLPVFGRFGVREAVRVAYVELEEPEAETKKRLAAMMRAQGGKGPEPGQLRFFSRDDLYGLRLLPYELLTTKADVFAEAIKAAGVELLILIALRKFVPPGQSLLDPEVAEQINSGLCALRQRARVAIVTAHHDRKSPATTVEALGFGSTMLGAEVDAVFDLRRRSDGAREVCFEGRYRVEEEKFCLELSRQGDGELIVHAPWLNEEDASLAELRRRVAEGESINHAAKELRIPKSTAYNRLKG